MLGRTKNKDTAKQALGIIEKKQMEQHETLSLTAGLQTDFDTVRQVYLVYPEDVQEGRWNYSHLTDFYKQLIRAIPEEIEVVLLVKSRELVSALRVMELREQIRYVVHSELESIWLRDYAGFNMGTHLVKPVFSPKRIGDNMKLLHSLMDVDLMPLDLVWDGGNLVTNGQYGFISTKIQEYNKKKSPEQIMQLVEDALQIKLQWVELPEVDTLAHTDGYMTFISPTQALVSTYPADWAGSDDQKCVDALAQQLLDLGLKVERVHDTPNAVSNKKPVDSAVGIYVNLLQLNGTWLVPTYGRPGEDETLEQLKRLNSNGDVVSIECTKLAEMGGVLHCISFCN